MYKITIAKMYLKNEDYKNRVSNYNVSILDDTKYLLVIASKDKEELIAFLKVIGIENFDNIEKI